MQFANIEFHISVESFGQVRVHIKDDTLEHDLCWVMSARVTEELSEKLASAAKEAWEIENAPRTE